MNELKRHEIMRRIEYQDADEQYEPSPSLRDEAATRSNSPSVKNEVATRCPAEKKGDLKKQSQFAPEQIVAKSYKEGDCENNQDGGAEENKAKQSQSVRPLDVGEELPDCSKPVSRSRTDQRGGEKRQNAHGSDRLAG